MISVDKKALPKVGGTPNVIVCNTNTNLSVYIYIILIYKTSQKLGIHFYICSLFLSEAISKTKQTVLDANSHRWFFLLALFEIVATKVLIPAATQEGELAQSSKNKNKLKVYIFGLFRHPRLLGRL